MLKYLFVHPIVFIYFLKWANNNRRTIRGASKKIRCIVALSSISSKGLVDSTYIYPLTFLQKIEILSIVKYLKVRSKFKQQHPRLGLL